MQTIYFRTFMHTFPDKRAVYIAEVTDGDRAIIGQRMSGITMGEARVHLYEFLRAIGYKRFTLQQAE